MNGPHFVVTSTAKEHADYSKKKKKEYRNKIILAIIGTFSLCSWLYYLFDLGIRL